MPLEVAIMLLLKFKCSQKQEIMLFDYNLGIKYSFSDRIDASRTLNVLFEIWSDRLFQGI